MKRIIEKNITSSTDELLYGPKWQVMRHEGFSTSDWEVIAYGCEEEVRRAFERLVAENTGSAHLRLVNPEDVTVQEELADHTIRRL